MDSCVFAAVLVQVSIQWDFELYFAAIAGGGDDACFSVKYVGAPFYVRKAYTFGYLVKVKADAVIGNRHLKHIVGDAYA